MAKKYIWDLEEEKRTKQKKERVAKVREIKKKKKQKRNRRFAITFIICIFISFVFFAPFFKVDKVQVKNNFYFTAEKIKKDMDINERFSFLDVVKDKVFKEHKQQYLEKVRTGYNFEEKKVVIDVTEYSPLYHDKKGNNYYYDSKGRIRQWDIDYTTPLIEGISKKNKDILLEEMQDVAYDILLQIETIEMADKEFYGENVLKILMDDGNTIYIYPYQVGYKLNYYNQIKQILDANDKGGGNIYLYIGDYYEPYN